MQLRGLSGFSSIVPALFTLLMLIAAIGVFNPNVTGFAPDLPLGPSICGNTIMSDTTLDRDQGPCAGDGLYIGNDNIVLDCAGYSITGPNSNSGISVNGYNNITIKNCNIKDFEKGFYLSTSSNNTVKNNTAISTAPMSNGLTFNMVFFSNITNNTFNNNSQGMNLQSSFNNTIDNNTLKYNTDGMMLFPGSDNNTIINNVVYKNTNNGISAGMSNYVFIANNTVTNNSAGVSFNSCYNVTIADNKIVNSTTGIDSQTNSFSNITNNIVNLSQQYGINLANSINNTIANNTLYGNRNVGIYIGFSSDNNTLINNTANNGRTYGFQLSTNSYNTLTNNTANSNIQGGFLLAASNFNVLTNNSASNNPYGVYLQSSLGTTILNNTLNDNSLYGIYSVSGSNNGIVINNTVCGNRGAYDISFTSDSNSNTGNNICDDIGDADSNGVTCLTTCPPMPPITIVGCTNLGRRTYILQNDISNVATNCFLINANRTTLDCQGKKITGRRNGMGIYANFNRYNATVMNCLVTNFTYGIYVQGDFNFTLLNNTLFNNSQYGIYLQFGPNNTLINNTANNNDLAGIYLDSSYNNTIKNNTASNNMWDFSTNNMFPPDITTVINMTTKQSLISFSTDGNIALKGMSSSEVPADDPGFSNISKWINATCMGPFTFFLNFSYSSQDVKKIQESTLQMWKYDGANWLPDGFMFTDGTFGRDDVNKVVYANINSFGPVSIFAPIGMLGDTEPPRWSDNTSSIPATYSLTQSQFSVRWIDNTTVDKVLFESNFSGSPQNYTMSSGAPPPGGVGLPPPFAYSATLPAGVFYWRSWANDTSDNWNTSDTWMFTISKATSTCSLTVTPPTPTDYGTASTASCTCTSPEAAANLYRNDSTANNENGVATVLPAGAWEYVCNVSSSQNYSVASNSTTYTVEQFLNPVDLYLNNNHNQNVAVTQGTETNATGTAAFGTANLYRDGVAVSNPEIATLPASTYSYKVNATSSNQNYTDNSTGLTFSLTVSTPPAPPSGGGELTPAQQIAVPPAPTERLPTLVLPAEVGTYYVPPSGAVIPLEGTTILGNEPPPAGAAYIVIEPGSPVIVKKLEKIDPAKIAQLPDRAVPLNSWDIEVQAKRAFFCRDFAGATGFEPSSINVFSFDGSAWAQLPSDRITLNLQQKIICGRITSTPYLIAGFTTAVSLPTPTSQCPSCPPTGEYGPCVNGSESRQVYACNAETNYTCQPLIEHTPCVTFQLPVINKQITVRVYDIATIVVVVLAIGFLFGFFAKYKKRPVMNYNVGFSFWVRKHVDRVRRSRLRRARKHKR